MNKVLDKFFTKADNGTVRLYDYDVTHLWLAGLVYAHVGYWVENLFRLVSKGVLDSRNQLLPFLFCYTIAMWAMYLALGTTNHPRFFSHRVLEGNTRRDKILARIYYFTVVFLFVFFGEIVVGSIFEQVSGISLWDYSGIPLHVTKYTSIPTCTAMSLGVAVIMGNFFEGLMKKIQRIPYRTTVQLDYVLATLILADWLIMMVSINVFKKAPAYWSVHASKWDKLIHITLPGLLPTIIIMLILRMGSIFSVGYEKIMLMYNPATYETADVISTYVYRRAFESGDYSFSAAVGLFNSVINFTIIVLFNKFSKKISEVSLW